MVNDNSNIRCKENSDLEFWDAVFDYMHFYYFYHCKTVPDNQPMIGISSYFSAIKVENVQVI